MATVCLTFRTKTANYGLRFRGSQRQECDLDKYDPIVGFGISPEGVRAEMTGLGFIKAICSGAFPQPPIAKLFNFRIETVEKRRVVFRVKPSEEMTNPMGAVHGG